MIEYLNAHPWLWAIVALVASATVRSMPMPPASPQGFWEGLYFWFYNTIHSVAANWDKVKMPAMLPPGEQK